MSIYPTIRIEGGLLGPDTLEQLLAGELPGQRPQDFGLNRQRNLDDEIAGVFADARTYWETFCHKLNRLPETDVATSQTRDSWVIPFLSLLGYELHYNSRAYEVAGEKFAISHRAGKTDGAPPIHIVGARQELGRVAETGKPRLAPHSLVQEFLNRTEHLWGIVTNGLKLRLLRNSVYIRRQAYVEFDLKQMLEEQRFNDFAILYRLLHRTRLPHSLDESQRCFLEQYYQRAIEQGGRVRERLRNGVEECLKGLANGFLAHPANAPLRERLSPKAQHPLPPQELYRQLLRLVYRFLFLLVSEERGLISQDPLYLEHYGISRLRRLLDRRRADTEHDDLWCSLQVLWKTLSDEELAHWLRATPLNGELFEPTDLDRCALTNRDLLKAFWHIAYYQETDAGSPRRVNYAALDVEELGSVYESLLDYDPKIENSGRVPVFHLAYGSERKTTGSYYTPPELVTELIRSALEPVLEERLKGKKTAQEKEQAVLSMRVIDPACGSGHFLLAAARRLGKELARIRTSEDEPAPEHVRAATRDVITHCIYGVNKNPLAVELCKVALWIESNTGDKPLTFLDHRIRCGDSLVGVLDLEQLRKGIPEKTFEPTYDEDKQLARIAKRRNDSERGFVLFHSSFEQQLILLAAPIQAIEGIPEDTLAQVRKKADAIAHVEQMPEFQKLHRACEVWTAAFFQRFLPTTAEPITNENLFDVFVDSGVLRPRIAAFIEQASVEHRFFHWPLAFPEVFATGGFDVVLCNPPWERIKLQEQEFFATRDPEIARAPNKAARQRLIRELPQRNPALWQEYQQALHDADATSKFLRASGRFPLTARGDINTYSVFTELLSQLLRPNGRAGVVVPTGIATDATNQEFFSHLVKSGRLVSLYDFDNRAKLFPAVISLQKFCLLTIAGSESKQSTTRFAFFCHVPEDLKKPEKILELSAEDFALLNPNTRTCPIFRTRQDAELTKAIYRRVPVLVNEATSENPWGVRFMAMFHMANDSHLFRTRAELEREGFRLVGNRFVRDGQVWLPLYEAKMIWHYDHRYGTYAGVRDRSSTQLPTPSDAEHADPAFVVLPWYWVPADEVHARLADWDRAWLLGFRDVTNATNERTAIFSLLPAVGVGNNNPLLIPASSCAAQKVAALLANISSFVFDYVARQKIAGVHMNFFLVQQLPVLPPTAYTAADLHFIVPRVLELVYTAWDIKPFADDVWREADPALQAAIQAQWEANARVTANAPTEPPAWAATAPEGIPLAPFRWEAERRALLRAELDAYYARLYGLSRKQLRYILDPADLTERELADILDPYEEVANPLDPAGYAERCQKSAFPGETFRVLKEKELRQWGEYRTRRLVLEAWERLSV